MFELFAIFVGCLTNKRIKMSTPKRKLILGKQEFDVTPTQMEVKTLKVFTIYTKSSFYLVVAFSSSQALDIFEDYTGQSRHDIVKFNELNENDQKKSSYSEEPDGKERKTIYDFMKQVLYPGIKMECEL